MSTRDLILQRIAEIREYEQGFDRRTMKWKRVKLQGEPLQDLDFAILSDDYLVAAFEIILRWHYTPM